MLNGGAAEVAQCLEDWVFSRSQNLILCYSLVGKQGSIRGERGERGEGYVWAKDVMRDVEYD